MNILLTAINAKYIHSNLAIYSLKANAGAYSDHVSLAEFTINNKKIILSKKFLKENQMYFALVYISGILIM